MKMLFEASVPNILRLSDDKQIIVWTKKRTENGRF